MDAETVLLHLRQRLHQHPLVLLAVDPQEDRLLNLSGFHFNDRHRAGGTHVGAWRGGRGDDDSGIRRR